MNIHSKENLYGEYIVPSDKTITGRSVILGSIAKGKTYIVNPLMSADVFTIINCVKKIGARVKVKERLLEIRSPKKLKDNQKFNCDNSGTALRLLCGVVAGSNLKAIFHGDKVLNQRPMKNIKDPLERLGATVVLKNYTVPPVLVKGEEIKQLKDPIEVTSSQVKSAVLLCALQSGKRVKIKENLKTRSHTEILLKELGANIVTDKESGIITMDKSEIKGKKIFVCGDFSIAVNFIALGLLCGETTVKNTGVNPTRTALIPILRRMGAKIEIKNKRVLCGEPIADITAYKSKLSATHVTGEEVLKVIDELPILAVLMGMAEGESIISGLDDLQYKDSDRLTMIDSMINSIGGKCRKFKGGLVINGVERYQGGDVTTYGDGRLAMSAIIALSASVNGGETDDDNCLNAEFPGFIETFCNNSFVRVSASAPKDESNKMHAFIFNKLGVKNYTYSYLNVIENTNKKVFSEVKDFKGYTVNAPYSAEAIKKTGKLSKTAKLIKSVNAVRGNLGVSTDGTGLIYALRNKGVDVSGKKVLVVGLGSVGKSIAIALNEEKATVFVHNRTFKTALDFQKKIQTINVIEHLRKDMKFDIVINATPIGCGYYAGEMAIAEDIVKNSSAVVDLVIRPKETPLTEFARSKRKTIVYGNDALFFTSYSSCCFLVGKSPSQDEAFALFKEYFTRSDK